MIIYLSSNVAGFKGNFTRHQILQPALNKQMISVTSAGPVGPPAGLRTLALTGVGI